jgi:FKBP-type peptidyl-prolyl cis-trans isomerase 2
MTLKEGDFVELEYTGRTEDDVIFDTTDEKVARENELYNEKIAYGSATICLGEGHLLPGLDKRLVGQKEGKHTISLTPEEGFGKRDAKYIQLISTSKFIKQGFKPVPGLQVNVDDMVGVVKTVSGGRTIVDFNNPLAGRKVIYEVKIGKTITDVTKQLVSLMRFTFKLAQPEIKIDSDKAVLTFAHDLPKEAQDLVTKKISELTKIKKVEYLSTHTEKPSAPVAKKTA